MERIIDSALGAYLRTYAGLIAVEPVDNNSATLSFPFHLASNHRIEITISDIGNERCVVSDAGRTLGEMRSAGYSLSGEARKRLEAMAKPSGLRLVGDYLLLDSSHADIGASIQSFLETSKTIGDAYLVHRQSPIREGELLAEVKTVLDSEKLLYRENQRMRGKIESHSFNLVVPPNGRPGVAVSVLSAQSTHLLAEAWGWKCDDIRLETNNASTKLALIYDVRFGRWSATSRKILESSADIAIPGDSLLNLPRHLESQGVVKVTS